MEQLITTKLYIPPPGLATSLFLVLPLNTVVLWQAFVADLISMPRYLLAALGMLLGTAVIWPILFKISRRLLSSLAISRKTVSQVIERFPFRLSSCISRNRPARLWRNAFRVA